MKCFHDCMTPERSIKCIPGVLACLDGYMNIALEQTEEYVNGQVSKCSAVIKNETYYS